MIIKEVRTQAEILQASREYDVVLIRYNNSIGGSWTQIVCAGSWTVTVITSLDCKKVNPYVGMPSFSTPLEVSEVVKKIQEDIGIAVEFFGS